jgi:ribonucleoside-diphosphate reductase beta chain
MSDQTVEPLLEDIDNRFTIFPVIHEDIWNAFITHQESIWFVNDVDLTPDLNDWNNKLDDDERYFIKNILAFFAASDGIVNENLVTRFYDEIKWAEARSFYSMQIFIENEHGIMYSRLIETYVSDREEKIKLLNAVKYIPAIKQKADWALKWISSSESFATRLVAFAIVEGIFFSGAFCSIYWINEKKLMPGLAESNSYIARDEKLHCEFAVLLYNKYVINKPDAEAIYSMVSEAVEIEKHFINISLPCSLIGMNSNMMSEYIECCADRLLLQLGYKVLYNTSNPFPFMESICLSTVTNFFDTRSSDYKKKIARNENDQKRKLTFDADF